MKDTNSRRKQNHKLSLVSLLCALVIQLAYLPFHLVNEEHDGAFGGRMGESTAEAAIADQGHSHSHDPNHDPQEDNHPFHAVEDHRGSELMVPSMSSTFKVAASKAFLTVKTWSPPSLKKLGYVASPATVFSRSIVRFGGCPRGPPATV
ncbi:MAG: hypothetical protein COA70_12725 [Planctomycetota bacterium]|nr:MAG: hypothetical protein COA70_12725 [Planctomycetota bacterium]